MKLVNSITGLLSVVYLSATVAIDTPRSYLRSDHGSELQPELRILQQAENFTASCEIELSECLARRGSDAIPLNDWFDVIEGAASDPAGVSTQLLSVVQEAAVFDFEEMFLELKENLTPEQIETMVDDAPALIEKANAFSAALDSLIPRDGQLKKITLYKISKILAIIGKFFIWLSKIAAWIGTKKIGIFSHLHKILKITFKLTHWILKLFGLEKHAKAVHLIALFSVIGVVAAIAVLLGLVIPGVLGVIIIIIPIKKKLDAAKRTEQCQAELMRCQYDEFLLDTIPNLLSVAFPEA